MILGLEAEPCVLIPRETARAFRNDAGPSFRELLAP